MRFDLQSCTMATVRELCEAHHGYGTAGRIAAYAFAVYENSQAVAAYAWQPPPPAAASSVASEAPHGVLSLSRMVAVPSSGRALKHISKPLRRQMKHLIDRTRWPVLVTYHDEGEINPTTGKPHDGYVYKCSGWTPTARNRAQVFVNANGDRVSRYSDGATGTRNLTPAGFTWIQRWERHGLGPRPPAPY